MGYVTTCITGFVGVLAAGIAAAEMPCSPLLDVFKRPLAAVDPVHLCDAYRGKVVLIVNTASRCGYTAQYRGLQALYESKRDQGLVILAFPSNDFGGQESGSEEEIREFCRLTYGVSFPVFEKTRIARDQADPLYRRLAEASGEYPAWNFHKYLLDRQGRLVGSFPSGVRPDDPRLSEAVEAALRVPLAPRDRTLPQSPVSRETIVSGADERAPGRNSRKQLTGRESALSSPVILLAQRFRTISLPKASAGST